MPEFEFHVSRKARQKYQFDETIFALNGNVVLADFSAARRFAERMTLVRGYPVPASHINAMGLIDEILHLLVRDYEKRNPGAMQRALQTARENSDSSLLRFTEEFPPLPVYRGELLPGDYLQRDTGGRPNRVSTLEEMLILHITNQNPAVQPYKELFDEEALKQNSSYEQTVRTLRNFFQNQMPFSINMETGKGESLIDVLLAPSLHSPTSLMGQLEYLLERWRNVLGESFVSRILRGIDFVQEERIRHTGPGGGNGSAPVLTFTGHDYTEYERFSQDKDWMPRLVLIAKNSYVWLDQLSRKYQRAINRLNEIPDEELELLKQRGITGLWLIGLWERSSASKKIKQMMGSQDAVASAYSLMDYQIASDLGGWEALQDLRWRAWQRGVRLSADMVPNHMGIDSNWVVEHPDWFLSLPYSPYPNYSFDGADLSNDSRTGIQIEDHYYDKTDAAVVFKRLDRWTGSSRYIYHGNDGTSMPWNDTAQLDFSKAEVREAVIQTILHVARNFPVIRFDAAMTLAKKHIQRLWFPEPGQGGAIPSRSEHGLTRAQFDAAIPNEFWREVVDRVAAEVPDTLLLAEAFWLMEGYFVRTLGMHRVYNSAFMHMLRDEDNAKYRQVMKNTLEFDPQVLKRYVNFMNNPDEKTAAEQFGTQDKYFGVCTLMMTLPGLPMLGHGQIEGYREKYGMEYRYAKWQENVDEGLIRGHDWRIWPLTHRRHLFAEVDNFLLYDFFVPEGHVNEDVFAYSNLFRNPQNPAEVERSLVLYHNKYAETRGWIKTSAAYMDKASGNLIQRQLPQGLELPSSGYAIFKEYVSGLEYIRPCHELTEKGLYALLGGYQCQVFLDWRIVDGDNWKTIFEVLNGAGVPSMQARYDELFAVNVEPVLKKAAVKKKRTPAIKPVKKTVEKVQPGNRPRKPSQKPGQRNRSNMASRKISRRDFLKTTITGAGLVGLDGLLAACGYDLKGPLPSANTPSSSPANTPTYPPPTEAPTLLSPETATETAPAATETAVIPAELAVARGGEPEEMVRRVVAALGGMEKFVPSGSTVVVKPNICVASRSYEYAATTNPWVVAALVKMALEAGASSVKVMDNPFNGTQKQAYKDSGIQELVEAAGGQMVGMNSWNYVITKIPGAKVLKLAAVHDEILNADVLINVPIAKNHESEARLTLGMKNLMGVVQDRSAMHISLVQCIADLASLVKPQLTVIDAVRILTRNGPRGGRLADVQKLDTVIASPDIVAADSYAASLFGLTPADIAYIGIAASMGIGRSDLENLRIEEISLNS